MSIFQLALIRFALGAALLVAGLGDYRKAADPDHRDWFRQLDEALFPQLPFETLATGRKAAAALLIGTGLFVCATSFWH